MLPPVNHHSHQLAKKKIFKGLLNPGSIRVLFCPGKSGSSCMPCGFTGWAGRPGPDRRNAIASHLLGHACVVHLLLSSLARAHGSYCYRHTPVVIGKRGMSVLLKLQRLCDWLHEARPACIPLGSGGQA